MANGIRTGKPHAFNKGRSSKFRECSQVRQTPEEGRRDISAETIVFIFIVISTKITIKMKTIVRNPLMVKIDTIMLNTKLIIRYVSRVKWSNLGERVAANATPRCSSY